MLSLSSINSVFVPGDPGDCAPCRNVQLLHPVGMGWYTRGQYLSVPLPSSYLSTLLEPKAGFTVLTSLKNEQPPPPLALSKSFIYSFSTAYPKF